MRLIDADELQNVMDENIAIHKKLLAGETDPDGKDFLCYGITLLRCIKEFIDVRTTIDAEPVRHGHWIECESENGIHFHKCSECGKRDMYQGTFTDWGGRGFSFYYKRFYCPVCGAKMEEVEE